MEQNISTIYDYIVNQESRKMVGAVCKRIELAMLQAKNEKRDHLTFKEVEMLKLEQKELIYESFRNVRDILQTSKFILEFKQK